METFCNINANFREMYLGLGLLPTILGLNEKSSIHAGVPSLSWPLVTARTSPRFLYGHHESASQEDRWPSQWRHLMKWTRKEQPSFWYHRAHLPDRSSSPVSPFCDPWKPLQWWSPEVLTWSQILWQHFSKKTRLVRPSIQLTAGQQTHTSPAPLQSKITIYLKTIYLKSTNFHVA